MTDHENMLTPPDELLAKPCDQWCELEIMSAYHAIKELAVERDRWKENFSKVQERERIEWARAEKVESDLENLLSTLLGDGGQYQNECGTEAAIRATTELWSAWVVRATKAEADLTAARAAIQWAWGMRGDLTKEAQAAIAAARAEGGE